MFKGFAGIFDHVGPPDDPLVGMALQYLHGFTLSCDPGTPDLVHHGPPGNYLKSLAEVRSDLGYWRTECDDYDCDPTDWRARRGAAARATIQNNVDSD